MDYKLAAKIEARIKREVHVGFISKEEMKDGFTETASPEHLEQMMQIYEEEIAFTSLPFLRVM